MKEKIILQIKQNKSKIIYAGLILLFAGVCLWTIYPTLKIATYTYPVQDDFDYVCKMRRLVSNGNSILGAAWYHTVEFYKHFVGAYASSIMGFCFEYIVTFDQTRMAAFEIISILIFDASLALWVYAVINRIFKYKGIAVLGVYAVMLTFINNVMYYADSEDYYWLITSIQYLLLLAFALLGNALVIIGSQAKNRVFAGIITGVAAACLFWAAGANLILVFLNAGISFIVVLMLAMTDNIKKRSIVPIGCAFVGSVINGLAPGNYERVGNSTTMRDAVRAGYYACKYAYERLEIAFSSPVFIITLVVLMVILLQCSDSLPKVKMNYRWPLVVFVLLFGGTAATIFPGMLGYGYEVYLIMMRGNFLSDFMMFCMILLGAVYFVGWIKYKYWREQNIRLSKDIIITILVVVVLTGSKLRDGDWRWTPIARMYREISSGRMQEYSDYVWNVLEQVETSGDVEPHLYIDEVEDKTCLINPLFWYGDHEEGAAYFYSLSEYYGKKDVYLYNTDEKE